VLYFKKSEITVKNTRSNKCSVDYNILERRFQDAKGSFNDDEVLVKVLKNIVKINAKGSFNDYEEEIASIKVAAISLLKDCKDTEIADDIKKLIEKSEITIKNTRSNKCSVGYNILEQRFQDAKGVLNDDEEEIARIKTDALSLLKDCKDTEIANDIKKLRERADKEL